MASCLLSLQKHTSVVATCNTTSILVKYITYSTFILSRPVRDWFWIWRVFPIQDGNGNWFHKTVKTYNLLCHSVSTSGE